MARTLAALRPAVFSIPARSRVRHDDAGGNGHEPCGGGERGPVLGRRHPVDAAERGGERADAREADVEADLRDAVVGCAKQCRRALEPPGQQVLVRRLAERPLERADEVGLRAACACRERRRVERVGVARVDEVLRAEQVTVGMGGRHGSQDAASGAPGLMVRRASPRRAPHLRQRRGAPGGDARDPAGSWKSTVTPTPASGLSPTRSRATSRRAARSEPPSRSTPRASGGRRRRGRGSDPRPAVHARDAHDGRVGHEGRDGHVRADAGRRGRDRPRRADRAPLGLDFWIGLPPGLDDRVAPSVWPGGRDPWADELAAPAPPPGTYAARRRAAIATLPPMDPDPNDPASRRAYHGLEVPSAFGIGNARSLARMYAAVLDEIDGIRLLSPAAVAEATTPQTDGLPALIESAPAAPDIRCGLGYQLASPSMPGLGPASFGHTGAGGRLRLADPDHDIAFGYVCNSMRDIGPGGDPRWKPLLDAVRRCV